MKRSFRLGGRRADQTRDVHDEVDFYLEMRAREFVDGGMSPEDARRAAEEAFGNVAAVKDELHTLRADRARSDRRRDLWRGIGMDVTYALRSLRNHPGFTAAALATLALGIGATIAVFTVVNGVLLRPLPYRDPARIAMVWLKGDDAAGESAELPLSAGFYLDVRSQARAFSQLAAFRSWSYTLGGSDPERLRGSRVTSSLFDVLGVRPELGRSFTEEDTRPGGPRVVLLGHALWQRRFGGDRSIVGRQIMLSGESFTVVGIMPEGFAFPRGAELPPGMTFGRRTDLWTPMVFEPRDLRNYGTLNIAAVGRLRDGATTVSAHREVSAQLQRFLKENNAKVRLDYRVLSLRDQAGARVRYGLLVLMGAVGFVLLIACANVTSLLLARTGTRQREFALRAALGASRGHIARQLAIENGLLAVGGALLGVAVATWGARAMLALVPGSLPRADDVAVDWRVLAVAGTVAVGAAVVFAIGAALSVQWGTLAASLHEAGVRSTDGVGRRRGRRVLATVEVALSLMLLIGAALLARSFVELQRVRPGFDPTNAISAGVGLPVPGAFNPTRDGPHWTAVFDAIQTRLRANGAVQAAGAVSALPLSGAVESSRLTIVGRTPAPSDRGPMAQYAVVSGEYFQAMRIPILEGRPFDGRDRRDGAPVIVVSREFARRYFAGESPVGKLVTSPFDFDGGKAPRTIVGVVDDVRLTALDAEISPQVYVPQAQMSYPGLTFVIRTSDAATAAVPALKEALRAVDPTLAPHDVRSLDDVLSESLARQRFNMTLVAIFAGSALLLAVVGLYGVIALNVNQRRRELGVRLALGARPADVVRLVVAEGMWMTATGVVLGLIGARLLAGVVASLLYGVGATNPTLFAAAAAAVTVVSLAASYIPARRASRVDPTLTLRSD